jgi:hypothetical protein
MVARIVGLRFRELVGDSLIASSISQEKREIKAASSH